MPKLTKAVIDCSFPKEKHYFVWDTEIKGFGCQILKSGAKKTYVFYYHSPLTRKKAYIKIGCHGNITVDFAEIGQKIFLRLLHQALIQGRRKKRKSLYNR